MSKQSQTNPGRPKNCLNCKLPKNACSCGRPTKMNAKVFDKIFEAYSLGATDEQAAFFGNISRSTLAKWKKENHAFRDRIQHFRHRPILRALITSFNALATDIAHVHWFLERRLPEEYAPRQRYRHGNATSGNKPTNITKIIVEIPKEHER